MKNIIEDIFIKQKKRIKDSKALGFIGKLFELYNNQIGDFIIIIIKVEKTRLIILKALELFQNTLSNSFKTINKQSSFRAQAFRAYIKRSYISANKNFFEKLRTLIRNKNLIL